jgi:hypothetical protein
MVRPIWQIGQFDFVQKLPKTPLRPKLPQNSSRTSPPLNKKSNSTTETFLLKKHFMIAHKAKPVRPV